MAIFAIVTESVMIVGFTLNGLVTSAAPGSTIANNVGGLSWIINFDVVGLMIGALAGHSLTVNGRKNAVLLTNGIAILAAS